MAFENATGISPSEVILALAGWMLVASNDQPPVFILVGGLVAAAGSSLGAALAYWAARLGGRPLVDRLVRFFGISPLYLEKSEQQVKTWGVAMVFLGRLIPGVRTLISIPAGLSHMRFPSFLAATFVGTYIWCTLFIGAGYWLGHQWQSASRLIWQFLPFILAGLVGALIVYVIWRRQPAPALVRSEME